MKDGGPAYPGKIATKELYLGTDGFRISSGMTLLQHYAGLAMLALVSDPITGEAARRVANREGMTTNEYIGLTAFELARAMIEAEQGGYFIPFGPSGKAPEEFLAKLEAWGKEKLREG